MNGKSHKTTHACDCTKFVYTISVRNQYEHFREKHIFALCRSFHGHILRDIGGINPPQIQLTLRQPLNIYLYYVCLAQSKNVFSTLYFRVFNIDTMFRKHNINEKVSLSISVDVHITKKLRLHFRNRKVVLASYFKNLTEKIA